MWRASVVEFGRAVCRNINSQINVWGVAVSSRGWRSPQKLWSYVTELRDVFAESPTCSIEEKYHDDSLIITIRSPFSSSLSKLVNIISAFQNVFIRCHRLPKSISWWGIVGLDFTWLSRQASCHQSMPWPRGSDPLTHGKIHLAFHCRNLLAIIESSRPLKKWMVFQWVVSYPLQ